MADDYDRPHHHIVGTNDHYRRIYVNDICPLNDACSRDHVVVVALDDYRELVAAARDRHPTNHQPGRVDPTTRPYWCHADDCGICRALYPADS